MLAENSNCQLLQGLFAAFPNCRMRWWWLGVDGDAVASDEGVTMVSVVVRLVVVLVCVDFLLKCNLENTLIQVKFLKSELVASK